MESRGNGEGNVHRQQEGSIPRSRDSSLTKWRFSDNGNYSFSFGSTFRCDPAEGSQDGVGRQTTYPFSFLEGAGLSRDWKEEATGRRHTTTSSNTSTGSAIR